MQKEMAERAIRSFDDPQMRLNHVREQLQRMLLTALHEARAFNHIAFVGGTCLRIVHGLRRYSEDLDFSCIKKEGYDFHGVFRKVKSRLNAAGIEHTINVKTKNTVHIAQIGFRMA